VWVRGQALQYSGGTWLPRYAQKVGSWMPRTMGCVVIGKDRCGCMWGEPGLFHQKGGSLKNILEKLRSAVVNHVMVIMVKRQ